MYLGRTARRKYIFLKESWLWKTYKASYMKNGLLSGKFKLLFQWKDNWERRYADRIVNEQRALGNF